MRLQRWIILFVVGMIFGAIPCVFMAGVDWPVSEIVYMIGFGGVSISKSSVVEFVIAWFPILFFHVWLGNYIYEHYCVSSVYFFSRCTKKMLWYLKEVGKLYLWAVSYVLVMFLGAFLLGTFGKSGCRVVWDEAGGILLFYYVAIYSLWLFATTLLINVFGIIWNNSKGFMLVVGAQMICTALYAVFSEWFNFMDYVKGEMETQVLILKLIPVSNLVLKWHSNHLAGTPILENVLGFEYEFTHSVVGVFVAAGLVIMAGGYVVKRSEFLDNGRVM